MKRKDIYSGIDKIPKGQYKGDVQEGCLVVEGGAFRGLYNEGVLDAFLANNINLHTVIGVSAGALAGANYVTGQIGRSARVNLTYRHDSNYIGVQAYRRSRSIVNLNFALKTYNKVEPFDIKRLKSNDRHFIAVATNCNTGETEYFDKDNCKSILKGIKASAAMPYMTPMVMVDGKPCLDGSCSVSIPYEWALKENFEKIIIVKTRERGYRKKEKTSSMATKFYRKNPEFAKSLSLKNYKYNAECDEIDELENTGRAFVIAPSEPVTVSRLEKDMEKLGDLYWLGYNDVCDQLDEIKAYLGIEDEK